MGRRRVADLADGGCGHEASSIGLEVLLGVLSWHGLAVTRRVGWTAWVVKPVWASGRTWLTWHTGGTAWPTWASVALVKWTWSLHSVNEMLKLIIVVFGNVF